MHNSYSSTDMSRWSNHNIYIFEHVSNIHNWFVPPYSSNEPVSHCTSQIHMSMSNCYSWTDLRTSADFDQSLYTALNSIKMEIAPNMISAPHVASSVLYLASPIYSRVEEYSVNTLAPGTSRSDFDKGYLERYLFYVTNDIFNGMEVVATCHLATSCACAAWCGTRLSGCPTL
jgi:hypothetical protein